MTAKKLKPIAFRKIPKSWKKIKNDIKIYSTKLPACDLCGYHYYYLDIYKIGNTTKRVCGNHER